MQINLRYLLSSMLCGGLLVCASIGADAQSGNGLDNPDWAEEQVPPPPALSKEPPIPIDMPAFVSVKVGVDPASIVVGSDGVVRYVMVMTNATGTTTAVYEGIRCITDQVKTYARRGSSGEWTVLDQVAWKDLTDNRPSSHSRIFARQGGCQNRLATSPREIIAALKSPQKHSAGLPEK